jgi:hypothetical protein
LENKASEVKMNVENSSHDQGPNLDLDYLDWWSKYYASIDDDETPNELIADALNQKVNPKVDEEEEELDDEDFEHETDKKETAPDKNSKKEKKLSKRKSKKKKIKKKLKKKLTSSQKKMMKKPLENMVNTNDTYSEEDEKNIETIEVIF